MLGHNPSLGSVTLDDVPIGMSRLSVVTFRLTRFLRAEVSAVVNSRGNVGLVAWRVLMGLSLTTEVTQKQLVAFTRTEQAQLSKVLRDMHTQGLVHVATSLRDRRQSLFSLTEKGHAAHADLMPDVIAFTDAIDDALTPEEQTQFIAMCERIKTAANAASTTTKTNSVSQEETK